MNARSKLLPVLLVMLAPDPPASAQLGASYCVAEPNSSGAPARLSASGSTIVAANALTLAAAGLPAHSAGYFLCSRSQAFVVHPGGSAGNLCLGSPVGRGHAWGVVNSGAAGFMSVPVDLTAMPGPAGAVAVVPGETWYFQCWFRDVVAGAPTSNFTDGLALPFSAAVTLVPALVPLTPGVFVMGSSAAAGHPYYGEFTPDAPRIVTLSYPFSMGRTEVTQEQYRALMGTVPAVFAGDLRPVETVSWHEARAYCVALTTLQASLGNVPPGYEYRLPTEAEWEYACRAGTTSEFHFGAALQCGQARFAYSYHTSSSCGQVGTALAGSTAANAFGLREMHGNVAEWCLDSFAPYPLGPATDPFVTGGAQRVVRGGSWDSYSDVCRSARRTAFGPTQVANDIGFRVVLGPARSP